MKALLVFFFLLFLYAPTILCHENKYSPANQQQQQQNCSKDNTTGEEHCEARSDKSSGEDEDEPSFYEDEDVEDPAEKWKGRESLFQWDPVKVNVI